MKSQLGFLIASLVSAIITLIVTIVINAVTDANAPDNDYARNTGWSVLMPAPAISLVWAIVDLAVFFVWKYHVIHWLVTCVVLGALNAAIGIVGVMLYEWDDSAWVAGMFLLFAAVFYWVFMGFAAVAVHRHRKGQAPSGTPLKNVETGDSH